MGSHSVEPDAAPLTRRRLRAAERTTDPTPEVPSSSAPGSDPRSPVSVHSGSTPALGGRSVATEHVPTPGRGVPAGAGVSAGAPTTGGEPTPPVLVTRYVSRPSAEPDVATPVRPMVAQVAPLAAPASAPLAADRPAAGQPGREATPATPPRGRRAARPTPEAPTSALAAPASAARPAATDALPPAPASDARTAAAEAGAGNGAPTSRRASRAAQADAPSSGTPAPVRRARPRAQSSVAIPVPHDQVAPTAAQPAVVPAPAASSAAVQAVSLPASGARPAGAESAPRPTSVLLTSSIAAPSSSPRTAAAPWSAVTPVALEPAPALVEGSGASVASAIEQEPELHRTSRVIRTVRPADATAILPAVLADESAPWELVDTSEVATTTVPDAVAHGAPTRRSGRATRVAARLGVLGVLAGITVIIPVSQGIVPTPVAYGSDALADSTLPSTVTALSGSDVSDLPPASLVSADGTLAARVDTTGASRNDIRSSLPGCDGSVRDAGVNGLLKAADLCTLWDNHTQLRADAAVSLAEFNEAFAARFGADLCLSSGYRTLAEQRVVKAEKGGLAAAPGKSNHGWGLAVDLCQDQTTGPKWAWLNENGPAYGWANPAWAQPGGSGPHERWHWEYSKGVKDDGEYYDG